jgi:thioredoxin reductase (NADPH)
MSAYLVQELERADNLTVRLRTEVATVHGQGDWSHSPSETEPPIHREAGGRRNVHHDRRRAPHRLVGRHLERDNRGFLLTGRDLLRGGRPPSNWPLDRPSLVLETSLPGVVAAGDIRHGSVKRVAGRPSNPAVRRYRHDRNWQLPESAVL